MRPAALAALALSLCACSALLNPEGDPIHCMGTGADDTCAPWGMACVDGTCQPVDGGMPPDGCGRDETCNGIDDNCNGLIDEDPTSDVDRDGYTFCGTDGTTGRLNPARVDCNNNDPSIHPGAPEICDGKDNDCNGMIDEGMPCTGGEHCYHELGCHVPDCSVHDPDCSAGMRCAISNGLGTCMAGDCRMDSTLCTGAEHCDPMTGSCVTRGPLGAPCASGAECTSDVCFTRASLGLNGGGGVCGTACCSDSDCLAPNICFASGIGSRSCLPASTVGRTSTGMGGSGSSCGGDGDCYSGLCGSSHDGCLGACGATSDCSPGLTCSVSDAVSSYAMLSCVTPTGGRGPGGACCDNSDCKSNICLGAGSFLGFCIGTCSEGCRGNADCGNAFDGGHGYCTWIRDMDLTHNEAVSMCIYALPGSGGSARNGESCGSDGDCMSNDCEGSQCHDVCCTDMDCAGAGWHCLPGTGTFPTMRCR